MGVAQPLQLFSVGVVVVVGEMESILSVYLLRLGHSHSRTSFMKMNVIIIADCLSLVVIVVWYRISTDSDASDEALEISRIR
jgi:hypothetical protein